MSARSTSKRLHLIDSLLGGKKYNPRKIICPACALPMYVSPRETNAEFTLRYTIITGAEPTAKEIKRRVATVDHVKSQRNGGSLRWGNLVLICQSCNVEKGPRPISEWAAWRAIKGRPIPPQFIKKLERKER